MTDTAINSTDPEQRIGSAARQALSASAAVARRALAEPWLTAAFHDRAYIPQAHHRLISREMLRWAQTPESRLMIALPPQTGKSWTAVVWTTFWLLARNPSERIIMASCSGDLARYHGEHIRDRISEYGAVHGLYLKRGHNRQDFFATTGGGYVRCVGVGGTTTGFPATRFLMDDLFADWEEAMSPTIRDKRYLWAASVARTRMQRGGTIAHVGTRWNRDDVAGRLQRHQPDRWRVLRLPAIATSTDDPLGRKPGEPLPKPGYDEHDTTGLMHEWELAQQEQPPVVWEALYQGDPEPPGGALLDSDTWEDREDLDPAARPMMRAVSLDPSVGGGSQLSAVGAVGRQNTFGVVGGWLGDDGRVYWCADATAVMTPEEGCQAACLMAYELQANVIFVEGNQGGHAWASLLASAWDTLKEQGRIEGWLPRVDIKNATRAKDVRAHLTASAVHADRVRVAARLPQLKHEWMTWRAGNESPGRIDASGQLALRLLPDYNVDKRAAASPADAYIASLGNPWG